MKKTLQTILYALPGLVLAVGVKTFFAPCVHADGSAANCAACGLAVFVAGIALTVLAVVRAVLPVKARPAADAVMIAGCLGAFLLPLLMKTCMLQSMRCNSVMKPSVWLVSAVGIILFAAALAGDLHTAKGRK